MISIGNISLDSPFILAPLAGYSDLPFRLLCRKFGAGLCVSEMISTHGLYYKQKKTLEMLASIASEKPVSFQLFGADPSYMSEATKILSEFKPDLIDINMGCPVRKVTKKGAGAALMSTPELAQQLIQSVVKNTSIPVTVKFRAGVNSKSITAVDFGKMAQDNGACAVTVHGRTWAQGFTGTADWNIIGEVKDALQIPVIGNGDIESYQEGMEKMKTFGCDAVMVGRGALGNPWVFSPDGKPEQLIGIVQGVLFHMEFMEKHLPVDRMFGCIKNHIGRYFKNIKGSSNLRKMVYDTKDFSTLKMEMSELLSS